MRSLVSLILVASLFVTGCSLSSQALSVTVPDNYFTSSVAGSKLVDNTSLLSVYFTVYEPNLLKEASFAGVKLELAVQESNGAKLYSSQVALTDVTPGTELVLKLVYLENDERREITKELHSGYYWNEGGPFVEIYATKIYESPKSIDGYPYIVHNGEDVSLKITNLNLKAIQSVTVAGKAAVLSQEQGHVLAKIVVDSTTPAGIVDFNIQLNDSSLTETSDSSFVEIFKPEAFHNSISRVVTANQLQYVFKTPEVSRHAFSPSSIKIGNATVPAAIIQSCSQEECRHMHEKVALTENSDLELVYWYGGQEYSYSNKATVGKSKKLDALITKQNGGEGASIALAAQKAPKQVVVTANVIKSGSRSALKQGSKVAIVVRIRDSKGIDLNSAFAGSLTRITGTKYLLTAILRSESSIASTTVPGLSLKVEGLNLDDAPTISTNNIGDAFELEGVQIVKSTLRLKGKGLSKKAKVQILTSSGRYKKLSILKTNRKRSKQTLSRRKLPVGIKYLIYTHPDLGTSYLEINQ